MISFSKLGTWAFVFSIVAAAALAVGSASAQSSASTASQPVLGSPNTVTADPPVRRPHSKPCIVQLFSNDQFADFSLKSFQYTPPAECPGPWAKVVFTGDFNVTAGRQFDRSAAIYLGRVNIYFGTTPEPSQSVSPSWHFERDLTDYSAIFASAQSGQVDLGNLVNSTYTGIIYGSAAVELYPLDKEDDDREGAPRTADAVYAIPDADGGAGFLNTTTTQMSQSFTLPANVERAYLDVIAQSQSNDEFWYTCVPNDVTSELQSCGNTGFREVEISIDGTPAGVAPVYPWIYTGGIDPYLWRPIPGVQALNFVPFRVDLTPFAGMLSNGQPHTVTVSVFNANQYFRGTGVLLVYLDHESQSVTGAVTSNTLASAPNPNVVENVATDASGNIAGTVTVTAEREFHVKGFVNTSHGRVDTEVIQDIHFSNQQQFTITAALYVQDIFQQTTVNAKTRTLEGHRALETSEKFLYPLTVEITLTFASDGISQLTSIQQEFAHHRTGSSESFARNKVESTDTFLFDSSFNPTGHQGQKSSQRYESFDGGGHSYHCSLASTDDVLTSASGDCVEK